MTVQSNFEMVQAFNKAMGVHKGTDEDFRAFRWHLINEEYDELFDEMNPALEEIEKPALAKELADLLYVIYGAADVFDIPIDEVFNQVHQSNMSKLDDDGKPVKRADGKVIKGPNYKPPNLDWVT